MTKQQWQQPGVYLHRRPPLVVFIFLQLRKKASVLEALEAKGPDYQAPWLPRVIARIPGSNYDYTWLQLWVFTARRRMQDLYCCLVAKSCLTLWLFHDSMDWSQAPRSMGFSRQEYWSGLPFPFLGIFPTQGWSPHLLHWQVDVYHWVTRETYIIKGFIKKGYLLFWPLSFMLSPGDPGWIKFLSSPRGREHNS